MSTADAVAREAAWLAAYSQADGLPGLLTGFGGPFDVVQAYYPRTPAARKNSLFVTRRAIRVERFGFSRMIAHYPFVLKIVWPLSSNSGAAELVQQALDDALDLVVQRISGPVVVPLDKTHGARFLSVAEDPSGINVDVPDPEQAIAMGEFKATITYTADDKDYLS